VFISLLSYGVRHAMLVGKDGQPRPPEQVMPSEREMTHLRRLERLEDERRRLNRKMVAPARHPDSGAILCGPVPNRFAATAAASAETRRWRMLPPREPAPRAQQRGRLSHKKWVRPLDLCLCGATKKDAAEILGITPAALDGALRRAYHSLGVHTMVAAGAVWRARAAAEGHVMNEDDAQALRARNPLGPDTGRPLTPRQQEALALLAQGIPRRDLPIALGVGPASVHSLLHDAYRRLGAHDQRSAVVRYLERQRFIGPESVPLPPTNKSGSDDDCGIPPERYLPP
jgi:DNA-binding CsgD family transcriptional regulator